MAVAFKSAQLTNIESVPSVQNPSRDEDARIRTKVFTYAGVGSEVATDFIRLGVLRKGYRLLGMRVTAPATFAAATGTIAIGVAGTAAKYLAATDAAAALSADANHTAALGHGSVLSADEELIATFGTAGAGAAIAGPLVVSVRYTRD